MILVTVGNGLQPFPRLLNAVEAMAEQGAFRDETVFIQTGHNPGFTSTRCDHEAFVAMDRFVAMIQEASLVICHAGAGTLLHVLQAGKIPVVMPRRPQHGELVDDHQIELVKALNDVARVVIAQEPEDLPAAVRQARQLDSQDVRQTPGTMAALVGEAIRELIGEA